MLALAMGAMLALRLYPSCIKALAIEVTMKPVKPPIYLREWRLFRNMTQAELSLRTGIDTGQISRFESGKKGPQLSSMAKLASALDCQPYELYGKPKPLVEVMSPDS